MVELSLSDVLQVIGRTEPFVSSANGNHAEDFVSQFLSAKADRLLRISDTLLREQKLSRKCLRLRCGNVRSLAAQNVAKLFGGDPRAKRRPLDEIDLARIDHALESEAAQIRTGLVRLCPGQDAERQRALAEATDAMYLRIREALRVAVLDGTLLGGNPAT